MARPVSRLYASAGALLALGLAWAGIAGYGSSGASDAGNDPRLAALTAREKQIEAKATRARAIVEHRWDVYRAELRRRKQAAAQAAATPAVRYVTLPPVTVSRSS
jgi:hypothetical protein